MCGRATLLTPSTHTTHTCARVRHLTPHTRQWRSYGGLIYLSNDFGTSWRAATSGAYMRRALVAASPTVTGSTGASPTVTVSVRSTGSITRSGTKGRSGSISGSVTLSGSVTITNTGSGTQAAAHDDYYYGQPSDTPSISDSSSASPSVSDSSSASGTRTSSTT